MKSLQKKAEGAAPEKGKVSKKKAEKSSRKPVKPKKTESLKKKSGKPAEPLPVRWWNIARQYLREVTIELRKVIWPSRKETAGSTSVVLVLVIICGLFLGFVDLILSRFMRLIIG